eukprot:gene2775-1760_t
MQHNTKNYTISSKLKTVKTLNQAASSLTKLKRITPQVQAQSKSHNIKPTLHHLNAQQHPLQNQSTSTTSQVAQQATSINLFITHEHTISQHPHKDNQICTQQISKITQCSPTKHLSQLPHSTYTHHKLGHCICTQPLRHANPTSLTC